MSNPLLLNILLHVYLLYTVLMILFYAYLSKIEDDIFNNELLHIIQKVKKQVSEEYYKLKSNYQFDLFEQSDLFNQSIFNKKCIENEIFNFKKDNNNVIYNIMFLFNITLLIIIISFIVYQISNKYQTFEEVKTIVIENLIILLFLTIVEFCFIYFVILKYKPSKPSTIDKLIKLKLFSK